MANQTTRHAEALQRGMDYMIRSALVKSNFDAFASDYLFFFADVSRYEDPWIAERARTVGLAPEVREALERCYPIFVGAMAEANWDYSRPRWVHQQFGI